MSRRFRGFLVSLIISFLLWVFLHLSGNFTVRVPFQVKLINIPQKHALWANSDSIIEAEISGKGFSLIHYYYTHLSLPVIEVDYSRISVRLYDNKLWGYIPSVKLFPLAQHFLPESINITAIQPDTLRFSFANLVPTKFSIRPEVNVQCSDGFMVSGPVKVSPANIEAYVLSAEKNNIRFLTTETIEIKDASDTIVLTAAIKNPSGLTFSRFTKDSITIKIPVAPCIESSIGFVKNIDKGKKPYDQHFLLLVRHPESMSIEQVQKLITIKSRQTNDSTIFSIEAPDWLIINDFNPKSISND